MSLRASFLLGLVLAALLAGCGSNNQEPAASAAGTTSGGGTDASGGGGSIKIMVIADISQVPGTAPFPEIIDGAKGAVNDINSHGGVNGQKIDLEVCDNRGDANVDAQCGQKAVSDHVAALVGGWSITSTHLSVTSAAHIPDIGIYPVAPISYTSSASFPLIGGAISAVAGPAAALADAAHVKSVSMITSNEAAAATTDTAAAKRVLEPRGIELKSFTMPPGTPDPSPYLNQMLRSNPEGALFFVSAADNDRLTVLLHQVRPSVVTARSATSMTAATIKNLGGAAEGMVVSSQYLPATATSNPNVSQWVSDAKSVNSGTALSDFNANGWASVQVFAQAAEMAAKQGGITAANITKVLGSNHAWDTKIGPTVNFATPLRDSPAVKGTNYTRVFNVKVTYSKIEKGQFVSLNNGGFYDPFVPTK